MQAGWYPDPAGDHEFRYHNGNEWTGDVATNGARQVSTLPPPTPPPAPPSGPVGFAAARRTDPRSGTTAMVFGILSMSLGWIPFVCFVAGFFALVAIVIGIRRRRFESARGAATAGIVTGVVGLLLSVAAAWVSVIIVQAVADFEDPGPHEIELTDCTEVDGVTRARGQITNLDDAEHSYTIEVSFDDEFSAEGFVADVPAGERRVFVVDEDLRFEDLDCEILKVNGPRPFGLEQ